MKLGRFWGCPPRTAKDWHPKVLTRCVYAALLCGRLAGPATGARRRPRPQPSSTFLMALSVLPGLLGWIWPGGLPPSHKGPPLSPALPLCHLIHCLLLPDGHSPPGAYGPFLQARLQGKMLSRRQCTRPHLQPCRSRFSSGLAAGYSLAVQVVCGAFPAQAEPRKAPSPALH